MPYYRRPDAVYDKPPASRSDQAEHHAAAAWHVCAACHESYLCRGKHDDHGHRGCPGKPYVFKPYRRSLPADWPEEKRDATPQAGPAAADPAAGA
jgi:hypothetical protein